MAKTIDNLIEYLEECINEANKLKQEGPNEHQNLGSLVLSIKDGLREYKM